VKSQRGQKEEGCKACGLFKEGEESLIKKETSSRKKKKTGNLNEGIGQN